MQRLNEWSGSRPIYLCTIDELVGASGPSDDEHAVKQMDLLASILQKLGYQLISGEAPRFHELWAAHIGTIQ
jgi:hypothetical protein